jgi:hypothetical protein
MIVIILYETISMWTITNIRAIWNSEVISGKFNVPVIEVYVNGKYFAHLGATNTQIL